MKTLQLFFFLIACMVASSSMAQEYTLNIKRYSVEDGLTKRHPKQVCQDGTGFIWVINSTGVDSNLYLDRFDGKEFKNFPVDVNEPTWNAPVIHNIHVGLADNLWLHRAFRLNEYKTQIDSEQLRYNLFFAIHVFEPMTGTVVPLDDFLSYRLPFELSAASSLSPGSNKEMFIGTINGEIFELRENGYDSKFKLEKEEPITGLIMANNGFWVITNDRFIKVNQRWEKEQTYYMRTAMTIKPLKKIIEVNVREPWVSSAIDDHGRLHFVAYDSTFHDSQVFQRRQVFINGALQETSENLDFIAITPDARVRFALRSESDNTKSLVAINTRNEVIAEQVYDINSVESAFFDEDENLWLTTENGLVMVQLRKSLFKQYLAGLTSYLSNYFQTRGIEQINDSLLLVGGLGKLHLLNTKTGESRKFDEFILTREVQRIDGNIWIGEEEYKIYELNPETWKATTYDFLQDNNPTEKNQVPNPREHWKIHKDGWGNYWAGSLRGLTIIDTKRKTLSHLPNTGKMEKLKGADVIDIHENSKGMWLGTTRGVYLFDPIKKTILAHYHTAAEEGYQLPHNDIAHIYEDQDGIFWLASRGGGLIRWEPKTGQYRQFTTEDGLSHDVVYAVYEDHNQHLWLPSFYGVNQFHKVTYNTSYYLKADGITHDEFNTISHFRGHDSTLYFGGLNGVNAFHPKDFSVSLASEPTPLVITGLSKQDKSTGLVKEAYDAFERENQITLYPSEVGFNLSFRLLDYSLSKEALYAYRIDGLDADWNYQSVSDLRMNRLPYGDYEFQLKASAGKGVWTDPITFRLIVIRPFYLQGWFIFLSILVITAGIYLLFYFRNRRLIKNQEKLKEEVALRTRKIEKQSQELKKLDTAKSQFFANVSHELRTPLTLILSPLRELINEGKFTDAQVNQLERMYRNGHNLSILVEEILELSKLEAGKLEIKESEVEVKPFLNRVVSAYESLATNRGIDFSCHLHFSDHTTLYLDEGKLEKVINNLISNALKFTEAQGFVKVSAFLEYDHLRILVEDSGRGISPKDQSKIFDRYYQGELNDSLQGGTGIGLALAKELTEAMEGTITVESKLKEGSAFQVVLPRKEVANVLAFNGMAKPQVLPRAAQPLRIISNEKAEFTLLLVEDNTDMQHYIAEVLSPQYNLVQAENGKVALQCLKQQSVDLIISDVMMPEMDGFTLLKILKSNDLYHHLPVIMLTARAENSDKLSALTIGVDDYLTKPFMAGELKLRVKNLLVNYKNRESRPGQEKLINDSLMSGVHTEIASNEDLGWIKKVEKEALSRLNDFDFSMETVAEALNITDRQLQRKVKQITGLTPNKYIQELRLQLGRVYLEKGAYKTINEVTLAVGFKSSRYFSKLFRERFGKSALDFVRHESTMSGK